MTAVLAAVVQPGDWADWQQVPAGCTCHWSDLRAVGAGRDGSILLPHGTWRYAAREPACPRHRTPEEENNGS